MKTIGLVICLLVLMSFFSVCASTGFLMAKPKVTMLGNAYPPKDKEAAIDVYVTNRPTQEYVEFAQIVCADTNLQQIQKKAREIGADAIIITGNTGSFIIGSSTYAVSKEYGMTAIAIKYK